MRSPFRCNQRPNANGDAPSIVAPARQAPRSATPIRAADPRRSAPPTHHRKTRRPGMPPSRVPPHRVTSAAQPADKNQMHRDLQQRGAAKQIVPIERRQLLIGNPEHAQARRRQKIRHQRLVCTFSARRVGTCPRHADTATLQHVHRQRQQHPDDLWQHVLAPCSNREFKEFQIRCLPGSTRRAINFPLWRN